MSAIVVARKPRSAKSRSDASMSSDRRWSA
jgi:hypothetical protein